VHVQHPIQIMSNGGFANGIMDPPGTIDPSHVFGGPTQPVAQQQQASRGLKRSRSPETPYEIQGDDTPNNKRSRGRPPKTARPPYAGSPNRGSQPPQSGIAPPVQTPQLQTSALPQGSPPQVSPSGKGTPTKPAVIKALPTVRDHTTDQLNPEGDEYIPREIDEAGERKVTQTGHPLDGREYRCRTFFVPNRADKLFMLATECARVLGYRDSYLLFNKNRSLYKIIATQAEKDDLIHQEILPYSYRSRQIAIVTARSMFRQFGSRLIVNGRRVRDDYWESKARKQGFTEEDAAGEKRPGAAKAREAAAAEANHASAMAFAHPGAYTGNNQDHLGAAINPLQPFGGLNPAPGSMPSTNADAYNRTTADLQPRDYSGVQRPRHEMQGAPYQDLTRPTPSGEILNAAAQTAEVNKQLEQQRKHRKDYLNDVWQRPHEPPVQPDRPGTAEGQHAPQVTQTVQSPRMPSTAVSMPGNQYGMPAQTPQRPGQSMSAQAYRPQPMPQNNMVPSPMAQQHTPLRPDQMHRRPPSIGMQQGMNASSMGPGGMLPGVQQNPGHGYPPSHMWQGPPQPSPLSQQHNMQQYAQRPQQSPLPQQSPMHASPQLHHAQSSASMHGTPVQQYQTMGAMGGSMPGGDPGYQAMGQNPYQPSPSPHQFMQHQSAAAQQPGMPGWAPPQAQQQGGWSTY